MIDPAPAIARQTRRLLEQQAGLASADRTGHLHFITSGPGKPFAGLLPRLLGESGPIEPVSWDGLHLPD